MADDSVLEAIAGAHRKSAVQVALRWLIQEPGIAAIRRTSNPARLGGNASVFDFQLTGDEMDRISRLKRPISRLINEPAWVPRWD